MSDLTTVILDDLTDKTTVQIDGDDIAVTLATDARTIVALTGQAGVPGAAGADGVDGGSYRHLQGVASTVWTVPHGLGYYPGGIRAFEDLGGGEVNEIEGQIEHVNTSTLTITFSAACSGWADVS